MRRSSAGRSFGGGAAVESGERSTLPLTVRTSKARALRRASMVAEGALSERKLLQFAAIEIAEVRQAIAELNAAYDRTRVGVPD